jgi:hypothetical protein
MASRFAHGFVAISTVTISTGDGLFIGFMAKPARYVLNGVYAGVRVSVTVSLCVV